MKGLKQKGWTPQPPPPDGMCSHIRKLVIRTVDAKWFQTG